MKRESVYTITELLVILIDHLSVYPVAVVFMEFLKVSNMGLSSEGTGFFDGGVSCWILGLVLWTVLYLIYALFFVLNKYIRKIDGLGRTKKALNPGFGALILVVCIWISDEIDMIWWPAVIQIILVFGLYAVFLFLTHYQEFLMVSEETGLAAKKKVLKAGVINTFIFSFSMMGIMTGVSLVPPVRQAVDAFFVWIRGLIHFNSENNSVQNAINADNPILNEVTGNSQTVSTPTWFVIIEVIAAVFVVVFLVIGVWALMKLIIKSIIESLLDNEKKKVEIDERTLDDVTDSVESLAVKRTGGIGNIFARFRQSPEEKIRGMFKKYASTNRDFLEKKLGSQIEYSTASEIAGVGSVDKQLADIYERARYSKNGVDASEVKRVKEILK